MTRIFVGQNQIALVRILVVTRNIPTHVLIRTSDPSLRNIQQWPPLRRCRPPTPAFTIFRSVHREGFGRLTPGPPCRFPWRIVGGRKTQPCHDQWAGHVTIIYIRIIRISSCASPPWIVSKFIRALMSIQDAPDSIIWWRPSRRNWYW